MAALFFSVRTIVQPIKVKWQGSFLVEHGKLLNDLK